MADEELGMIFAKIKRILDVDELMQHKIGAETVVDVYAEDAPNFQIFYSVKGSIHLALSEDGRFQRDGYYGHARIIRKSIEEIQARDVLELGSGRGFNLIHLAKQKPEVRFEGIDLIPANVQTSRKCSRMLNHLGFQVGNIEELGYASETFDIVFTVESLSHVANIPKALSEAYRVLKPGGRMVVFDLYCQEDLEAVTPAQKKAIQVAENSLVMLSPMTAKHLAKIAQAAGFRLVSMENLSRHVLPDVKRRNWLVELAFDLPWITRIIMQSFSLNTVRGMVAWELIPTLFKANLLGYYQVVFEKTGEKG